MVKRFQMKTEHDWVCARPDPKGDWVRFSDYEAAERLAGARVKMPSGELCRYIEQCREISNGGEYPWWSRLAEILSALAEPAGEAGPSKWSIPGSTYAGATTSPASAIRVCATEGCSNLATVHFVRGEVGSDYCHSCYMRVQALAGAKP